MEGRKHHVVDIVFVLSLFCAFAVMALFVVVLGTNVYKSISANMNANYNSRTSVFYLTEKVRQTEGADSIEIREFGGSDALVLSQDLDGEIYETWIFVSDGYLSEVLLQQGKQPSAGFAQAIMQIKQLSFARIGDHLLQMSVTDADGKEYSSMVSLLENQ